MLEYQQCDSDDNDNHNRNDDDVLTFLLRDAYA